MNVSVSKQPLTVFGLALCLAFAGGLAASAEDSQSKVAQPSRTAHRIGIQGFGTAALSWPLAKESFEAVGLDSRQVEFGGGVQVSDIWRNLFVEVSGSRWSSVGERTFVDDTGTRFPLGIPLRIHATYLDVSVGWKFWGQGVATYIGGGPGIVMYSEKSPFAESGEDLDTRPTSYHVLLGFEVPLRRWLGVTGDVRYRIVPDLLGAGGVSAVSEEDRFGGWQSALGLRVGFGGSSGRRRPEARPAPKVEPPRKSEAPAAASQSGVISAAAPVFLFPDTTRKPLRILDAGTSVRILQQTEAWVRVEFRDPQFGPRQGYVERKHVRIGK